MKVNAVPWYPAADPERPIVSVANWRSAVQQAAEIGSSDTIGQSELDGLLRDRLSVEAKLRECRAARYSAGASGLRRSN